MSGWQVFWATLILAWALSCAVAAYVDVHRECARQALLEALWADEETL